MTRLRSEDAKKRRESGRGPDFLEVLDRSLKIIDALGQHQAPPTLSDLARATDLPRPSVRRVLHTLATLGYVEITGRTFKLAPKIMHLATSYLGTSGNSRILQFTCENLSSATGQSCLVGTLDAGEVLVLAYTMPPQLMAPARGVGYRLPAFCTAAGRVLLAQLGDDDLSAYMKALRPTSHTEFTITSKSRIKAEIIAVRKRGFACMDDEFILGWTGIAYPLRRHDGSTFAALSLNIKKSPGLTEAQLKRFAKLCADEASALMPLLV